MRQFFNCILATIVITTITLTITGSNARALDLDVISVRTTISKPDTSHSLVFAESGLKSVFNLTPINNERLGLFLDINGVEIGYASDVFSDDIETKTENIFLNYRKLKHSRITLNYQILEGLETRSENLSSNSLGDEERFLRNTKSTKFEIFGLHNLYTFNEKESLFQHFFLNQPKQSSGFDWAVSVVGGWSYKHLSITNDESIIFQPTFIQDELIPVTRLDSDSFGVNIGPMLSLSFPDNFHAFAEFKVGKGIIESSSSTLGLKESGNEKQNALGIGLSWTSPDEKTLVLVRGWNQKGRHIETSFGDLSVVYFF